MEVQLIRAKHNPHTAGSTTPSQRVNMKVNAGKLLGRNITFNGPINRQRYREIVWE